MKNLKLIALAIAFGISSVSFATTTKTDDPKSELREQIIEILGETINIDCKNDIQAKVTFTLNNKSEIVVVSVNCENGNLDAFIKSKLNYKKVYVKALNEGKIYHMPLKIVHE